jgi:hypothetical protein
MSFILLGILNSQAAGGVAAFGYIAGGRFDATKYTTVDKFLFPSDTRSTLATGLSTHRWYPGGMSDNGVAGYAAGGYNSANNPVSSVDKFAFSDDSRTTLGTGLSYNKVGPTGVANPAVAGYFMGGDQSPGGVVGSSAVDKFAFPSDTKSTLAASLPTNQGRSAGISNNGVAGYAAGGTSGAAIISSVYKLTFSTEAVSTLGTGLSGTRDAPAGFSNSGTAGYVSGGSNSTTVDKFAFPSDTKSTLATGLSVAKTALAGISNNGVAGYAAGGQNAGGSVAYDTVEKFAFPSDSRSALATGLSAGRAGLTGMSNAG